MNALADLDLKLPGSSFGEGSTIDATLRATTAGDVVAADGRLELVRSTTWRHTTWNPYATPFTATARNAEVVAQAALRPDGPLAAGRTLVRPVALPVPPEGPGSVQARLVEIGWAVHARLRVDNSRDAEVPRPITVLSARGTARPSSGPRRSPRITAVPCSGSSRCRAGGWLPGSH